MRKTTVYAVLLSVLFGWLNTEVMAETESKEAELAKLRAQVEALQRRTEQQQRTISVISERLEALQSSTTAATEPSELQPAEAGPGADTTATKSALSSEEMELVAGKGVQEAAPAAASTSEPVVKEAQPAQSVQDILREEHTLFAPRLTIEPAVTYSFSDRRELALSGFLALDAIFLGNISVDRVENHIVTMDLTGRYGFTDNLEVDVTVPFLYRNSEFESIGAGGGTADVTDATVEESDLGDISASVFYRLFRETRKRPDIVMNVGFRAPTGKDPFGIGTRVDPENNNLQFPKDLPTGNGVWAVTGGFSFLKTIDPAIVFANVGYTFNIERSFGDISANEGRQPGDVDLGDSVNFGFGTAFALNERFSLSLSFAQQFTFESEVQENGQPSQDVVGSDATVSIVNLGTTYAFTDSFSLVTNVGIGLTDDASDVLVTFRAPFQL